MYENYELHEQGHGPFSYIQNKRKNTRETYQMIMNLSIASSLSKY